MRQISHTPCVKKFCFHSRHAPQFFETKLIKSGGFFLVPQKFTHIIFIKFLIYFVAVSESFTPTGEEYFYFCFLHHNRHFP